MHVNWLMSVCYGCQGSLQNSDGSYSQKSNNGSASAVSSLNACSKGVNAMALSPDGTRVATAGRDGVLRVHDLVTGTLLTGFRVCLNPLCLLLRPLEFMPCVVSASNDPSMVDCQSSYSYVLLCAELLW